MLSSLSYKTQKGVSSYQNSLITSFEELVYFTGVVKLASKSFINNTALVSVNTHNIRNIADSVFYGCLSLTSIDLSHAITIGNWAFQSVPLSGQVYAPNLEQIGSGAFMETNITEIAGLGNITILPYVNAAPNGRNWGNYGVFYYCKELRRAVLPDSLTDIQTNSFIGCINLIDLVLPKSIVKIGMSAFYQCPLDGLEIDLPNLEKIDAAAFYKTNIKRIINLGKVTTIGGSWTSITDGWASYGAFRYCKELVSATMPDSLTTLQEGAFHGCDKLEIINIPSNVTTIGRYAFYGDGKLKYTNENAFLNVTSIGEAAFFKTGFDGQDLRFPNCAGNIVAFSFGYCKCRSLYLGKVSSVSGDWGNDYNPLHKMPNLEYAIFGDSLTSFGQNNFIDCNQLNTLIFLSITPPSLGGSIYSTSNNGFSIYVPDDSIPSYQTATNWSRYAGLIRGISQIPTDNPVLYEEIKNYL